MNGEGAIDKAIVHARIPLELKFKVIRKYGKEGAPETDAYIAALERATKRVRLSAGDLAEIQKITEENYAKRMANRELHRKGKL